MASNAAQTQEPAVAADSKVLTESAASVVAKDAPVSAEDEGPKQASATSKAPATKPTSSAQNAIVKPKGPPPGYKLVKRRKEDGTVVTMMRKMTPEELEAAGQVEPPPAVPKAGIEYKVVTVKSTDGSFIRVKRPIKAVENPPTTSATPAETPSSVDKPASSANTETNPKSQPQATTTSRTVSSNNDVQGSTERGKGLVGEVLEEPLNMDAALAEQKEYFRQRRMQKFKGSLIRGLGTVLGSSVSHMDFGSKDDSHHGGHGDHGDIQEGDIIDSDEDWSDDDMDDDHTHDHGHDDSHEDSHHDDHHNDHHDENHDENHAGSSERLVHFDTAGASKSLITGIAASAANAAAAPQKPAPAAARAGAPNSSNDLPNKEKVTYNVTIADLEESEKRSAEKDLERPLRRHWTNFAFYFMASLSIVLPLLFLLLALFIFLMNGKPVISSWKVMPDVIKVGVSAWPIVFAAVVAQVFKGYATWKVERGIRLMQLEQLIGSNSFGSAIKQPLVLRQLDVLSLLLLLTWCLSPLGSQALQRSYTTGTNDKVDNVTVYYLDQLGSNKVFSADWRNETTEVLHAIDNQFVAVEFLSTLVPVDQSNTSDFTSYWMDRYYHPIIYKPDFSFPIAGMGLPVVLPNTIIPSDATTTDENTPYEYIMFNVTSSYYNFTCGSWSLQNGSDLLSATPAYAWSASGTLGLNFVMNNETSASTAVFASANIDADTVEGTNATEWEFSQIQCDFEQVFIDSGIFCQRAAPGKNSDRTNVDIMCYMESSTITPADIVQSSNYGTQLEDFSDDWTQMGALENSNREGKFSTPTELYILSNSFQMDYQSYTATQVNLSLQAPPEMFSDTFANLFNTWVGIGYCPECQALVNIDDMDNMDASVKQRYFSTEATRQYSINQIYVINIPWVACFIVCTALLLIAGVTSVVVESMTVAPDTLGYVSTVARNSRYLHVKPTSGAMTGPERARKLADTKVMMQDVKSKAGVGKIALGLKTEKAVKLQYDRLYR